MSSRDIRLRLIALVAVYTFVIPNIMLYPRADEMTAQAKAIESRLRFASATHRPRISRYDIREFVY